MKQCSSCGEWVQPEHLSDHHIIAHNVGGAVGIRYFAPDTTKRQASYFNQLAGGHTYKS
jgi:hypothetical protein